MRALFIFLICFSLLTKAADERANIFDMIHELTLLQPESTFTWTSSASDQKLFRSVTLHKTRNAVSLVGLHLEYLEKGEVRTLSLRDVTHVDPISEDTINVYFNLTDEHGQSRDIRREGLREKSIWRTVLPEISRVQIVFGKNLEIDTKFYSPIRETVSTKTDERSRFDRQHVAMPISETETLVLDEGFNDRAFSANEDKRTANSWDSLNYKWFNEATALGMIIPLQNSRRISDSGIDLEPDSHNVIVFNSRDSEQYRRFAVSGNVRELGQFLALVARYSRSDFKALLEFNLVDESGDLAKKYVGSEYGIRQFVHRNSSEAGISIKSLVQTGETNLNPHKLMSIKTANICGKLFRN